MWELFLPHPILFTATLQDLDERGSPQHPIICSSTQCLSHYHHCQSFFCQVILHFLLLLLPSVCFVGVKCSKQPFNTRCHENLNGLFKYKSLLFFSISLAIRIYSHAPSIVFSASFRKILLHQVMRFSRIHYHIGGLILQHIFHCFSIDFPVA